MKQLFRNNYFEISLFSGIALGIAKADDNYALLLGFVVVEFKPYNLFRKKRHNEL